MKRKRRHDIQRKMSPFSTGKAVLTTIVICGTALAFVNKEVTMDETAKRLRETESRIAQIQAELAEAKIELGGLSSFPRISSLAEKMDMRPAGTKPTIVNIALADIPPEFYRRLEPVKIDSTIINAGERK